MKALVYLGPAKQDACETFAHDTAARAPKAIVEV
jgi:hypothetical protein